MSGLGIGKPLLDGTPGFIASILDLTDTRLELLGLDGEAIERGIEFAAGLLDGIGRLVTQILQGVLPRLPLCARTDDDDVAHGFHLVAGRADKLLEGGLDLDPFGFELVLNLARFLLCGVRLSAQIIVVLLQLRAGCREACASCIGLLAGILLDIGGGR